MDITTECDRAFIQCFAKAFISYCNSHDINVREVCREAKRQGKGNFYDDKVTGWGCGRINRPVYVYSLNALCEVIGLKLMDFVSVSVPSFYVPVSPHLKRKRRKPKS
jgi:hypothetical protein